ncbi:MAG: VWA domain-containing protein [Acidimicrobiia bacterium]|nr:VWA domain-containing protein [Acidimicrobiia bacterium]
MTGPVRDIASFAEALRGRGMTVTPDQMSDMARSLSLIDPARRAHFHAALRCLAITDPGDRAPFDEEFRRFFDRADDHAESDGQTFDTPAWSILTDGNLEGTGEEAAAPAGASAVESIAHRDFGDLTEVELAEARKMVQRMLWEPEALRTRRWRHDDRGRRPDLRRTFHTAVGPEGDLLRIEGQRRRTRQRPLIIIADISGSMERYAEMFLVFAHAANQRLRHVEVFTFSTQLTRITEDLARRSARDAISGASRTVSDWSGGTKIGEALGEWNLRWSRRMVRGGPVMMILSDGWDCGSPRTLHKEMGRVSRSVHRVLWLNPLAARADYRPATRGMKAALPFIDHLLPAASVSDLRGVVRLLESIGSKPRAATTLSER